MQYQDEEANIRFQLDGKLFINGHLVHEKALLSQIQLQGHASTPFDVASKLFWMRYVEEHLPRFAKSEYGIECSMRKQSSLTKMGTSLYRGGANFIHRCFKCEDRHKLLVDGKTYCRQYGGELV